MHPRDITIEEYSYELPIEKIALYPLPRRDESKLLVWHNKIISEDRYRNIAEYIPSNSLVILNNTRVIPARILFKKESGGVIEIFCLEPGVGLSYQQALNATEKISWKCMIGGASKWKSGLLQKTCLVNGTEVILTVRLLNKMQDSYLAEFSWIPQSVSFLEIIESGGEIPLPPYIKRDVSEEDKQRYQTVYAISEGSVAAPTAGLHFTEAIFNSLLTKKIKYEYITLHVGAGTFKPVKSEKMAGHEMHSEWIDVSVTVLEAIIGYPENIIAVGTTSLRTLESLYWMGVKCLIDPLIEIKEMEMQQWEVYEAPLKDQDISLIDSLQSLILWMQKRNLKRLISSTSILIAPGYKFRVIKALVTNFHQPHSTLLLIVAAICGRQWKSVYQYALEQGFRFLSYGDGSLLFV